jgi:hypothetical protein
MTTGANDTPLGTPRSFATSSPPIPASPTSTYECQALTNVQVNGDAPSESDKRKEKKEKKDKKEKRKSEVKAVTEGDSTEQLTQAGNAGEVQVR